MLKIKMSSPPPTKYIILVLILLAIMFVSVGALRIFDRYAMPIYVFGIEKTLRDKIVLEKRHVRVNYFSNGETRRDQDMAFYALIDFLVFTIIVALLYVGTAKVLGCVTGQRINILEWEKSKAGGVNLSSTGARPPETGVKNLGSTSPSPFRHENDGLKTEDSTAP